jgi:phage-related baseplate assembly protein
MSRADLIDLSRLPQPEFTQTQSYEELLSEMREELVAAMPESHREEIAETLQLESEPLTKSLEYAAYRVMVERQRFNHRSARLMLAYAEGEELDHIGVTYYQTQRLGLQTEAPEEDASYKRRLLLAYDGYSTAGSRQSYIYHALSADADVLDAKVVGNTAGIVRIAVLSRSGNGVPAASLLAQVEAALSAETVRPLNDQVDVLPADVIEYEIRASIRVKQGPASSVVLNAAQAAAAQYAQDRQRLGLPIIRDAVLAALWVESVEHVELLSPLNDIARTDIQAAHCTLVEVTNGD